MVHGQIWFNFWCTLCSVSIFDQRTVTAYLWYCLESTSLAQLLSTFCDSLCWSLCCFGCFLHSLLDFLPDFGTTDLLEPLAIHTHKPCRQGWLIKDCMSVVGEEAQMPMIFTSLTVSEMFSSFFLRTSEVFTVSDSMVFWGNENRGMQMTISGIKMRSENAVQVYVDRY